MKQVLVLMSLFFSTASVYSQNINLSNSIGDVNNNYTYGSLIKVLGTPDSIYSYDPKNLNPIPKSLAYNELFFDYNKLVIQFSYFMLDTLTKKTKGPSIEIYNGSSVKLNGDYLSDLDSTYIFKKYGKPESVNKSNEEFRFSYSFREKKYFSLLTFYFSNNGILRKVWINFGKYK